MKGNRHIILVEDAQSKHEKQEVRSIYINWSKHLMKYNFNHRGRRGIPRGHRSIHRITSKTVSSEPTFVPSVVKIRLCLLRVRGVLH